MHLDSPGKKYSKLQFLLSYEINDTSFSGSSVCFDPVHRVNPGFGLGRSKFTNLRKSLFNCNNFYTWKSLRCIIVFLIGIKTK